MYILLVVDKPSEYRKELKWEAAVADVREIAGSDASIELIAPSVLLLKVTDTLHPLSKIVNRLAKHPYRYVFLPEAPTWVKSTPPEDG